MAMIEQIKNLVNDAFKDAIGTNTTLSELDTTNIVSLGAAMAEYDLYEPFFTSLVNRIARTVYFVRRYRGSDRHILRDEHEYGAFIQKVYYTMPDAVDNPSFDFGGTGGAFRQNSPYDVNATIGVSALIYGGQGTWSIEIIRPIEQIKTAFVSPAEMASFIDGIYVTVDNAFEGELEAIVNTAANTGMANAYANGQARNLLAEYNANHVGNELTVAKALESADFLKYASMQISMTIGFMKKMSTRFNAAGYATFTPDDKLVVEMLNQFAAASDMYLQADTFHDELVKLPNFERVAFWQGSGANFAFADTSHIKITNEGITGTENGVQGGEVDVSGIIAYVHDIENVAAYFGNRSSWELYNPRSEVMIHGEKARKGFAVDSHANGVIFYIAESAGSTGSNAGSGT